jgi:hypothetical protein
MGSSCTTLVALALAALPVFAFAEPVFAQAPPAAQPTPAPPKEKAPGFTGPSQIRSQPTQTSPDFVPIPDRWRLGFPDWNRYERPVYDAPYKTGAWWDPYNQNVLKGDYPIFGQHYFLAISAISDSLLELRRIPIGSNVSARRPQSYEFFGEGDQIVFNQNWILSVEFFKGDTAFKPRDWEFRVTPVFNLNYVDANENGVVNIDVREGHTRLDGHISLQEFLVEYHLGDLSPYYDFFSSRIGIQPFVSDFRGFIFADNQLGARIFGNWASNRHQWNVAYFRPFEKDTNSGLNRIFDTRRQHVGIANYFFQDFIVPGYTIMVNGHYLNDRGGTHYDENGFLVRPAPVGTLAPKAVDAGWIGLNGDGHIGPLNITHAFYHVLGKESRNPINGKSQHISAQMAALELSVDLDWLRPRFSFFWASGDREPQDRFARGFDMILDNPNFAGAGNSYWVRQGLPLANTGLELKGRNSLIPGLRSSKIEGQPNFINPGLFLFNIGADAEVTPKLKALFNINYLRFHHTEVIRFIQFRRDIREDIGVDYSLGVRWRPFLIENFVVTAGVSALQPLGGIRDIYTRDTFEFTNRGLEKTRSFPYDILYSGFLALTLTY